MSISFLEELVEQANLYAAIQNSTHAHWAQYGNFAQKIRRHIETLNELNVEQIRPLMLACLKRFTPQEVEKSFRQFISWVVRFMVSGTPTGTVEKYYAGRAVDVWKGEIKTASELLDVMKKNLPTDEAFQAAFASLRVSKSHLARYYLRSLERTLKGEAEPEWIVNDDPTELTLEHVLPENPSSDWGKIDPTTAGAFFRRVGNLILLRLRVNSTIGNASFAVKKREYQKTSFQLTKQVVGCDEWGPTQINDRQQKMAVTAVKTWPLKIR